MTSEPQADATTRGWDTYWQGTGDLGAWTAGGVSHPAIRAYWEDFFSRRREQPGSATLLDLASGNGAVVECALGVFADGAVEITCVDLSEAAIKNIGQRFPGVRGLACDAASIPLESATFDLVTSQFGVEYAGAAAIDEAARLLAPGGSLALMLHHRNGSIQRECAANLDAATRVRDSAFVARAREMFRAGFAAVRGADRRPYDDAAARLAPAAKALEEIIGEHGARVAGDTVARLYQDVAQIHARLPHYEPDEVLQWLDRMDRELDAYAGRMSSMLGAALDAEGFERIRAALNGAERSIERAEPLTAPGEELPLAWIVEATAR